MTEGTDKKKRKKLAINTQIITFKVFPKSCCMAPNILNIVNKQYAIILSYFTIEKKS